MEATVWTPLFVLAGTGLLACSVAALTVASRSRQALGTRLSVKNTDRGRRFLVVIALAAASFWLSRHLGFHDPIVIGVLVLACVSLLLRPSHALEVCGAEGVQRGWTVRAFSELEEWRLVGDHLRFRVGERWLAIELPRELFDPTLAALRARAPERESPFK